VAGGRERRFSFRSAARHRRAITIVVASRRGAAERRSDNYQPAGSPGNPVNDRRAMVAIIIDYAAEVRETTSVMGGASVACVLPVEKRAT